MNPDLYNAAMKGNVEYLDRQSCGQLEVQVTPNKNTVLHVAAQYSQTHCVKKILDKCGRSLLCSVNIKGETSLHISARQGCADIVTALIEYAKTMETDLEGGGGNELGTKESMLRMINAQGNTALHEAVRTNIIAHVVAILTKEDPDFIHPPNNAKETPLYSAALRHNPNIVSNILENCNSPDYMGPSGRTALHAATMGTYLNIDCIKIILEWKPSLIKEADVYGWKPLHYTAYHGHHNDSAISAVLLRDKSAGYLVTDNDSSKTALHIAADRGHVSAMKSLLSHCPDCWEMTDGKGQNILHIAVDRKKGKIIKYILKQSFVTYLINQQDNDGNTPLHLVYANWGYGKYGLRKCPKVDLRTCNKSSLSPKEMRRWDDPDPNQRVGIAGDQKRLKADEKYSDVERDQKSDKILAEIGNTQLIVATLVATVTFAAGFTVPGGYDGNNGQHQGMAVLAKRAAFAAFLVTDTTAMVFSITAVFLLLFSFLRRSTRYRRFMLQHLAFLLIVAAIAAMVIAFVCGLYAVLPHTSRSLAITVCCLCCFFFPIYLLLFWKSGEAEYCVAKFLLLSKAVMKKFYHKPA